MIKKFTQKNLTLTLTFLTVVDSICYGISLIPPVLELDCHGPPLLFIEDLDLDVIFELTRLLRRRRRRGGGESVSSSLTSLVTAATATALSSPLCVCTCVCARVRVCVMASRCEWAHQKLIQLMIHTEWGWGCKLGLQILSVSQTDSHILTQIRRRGV